MQAACRNFRTLERAETKEEPSSLDFGGLQDEQKGARGRKKG